MKKKLILRYIRYNKKQSVPLMISVFLATALLIGLLNVWMSFREMLIEDVYQNVGRHHICIQDTEDYTIDPDTIRMVENQGNAKAYGITSQIHEERTKGVNGLPFRDEVAIRLFAMDEQAIYLKPPRVHSGRLPKTDDEIALSRGIPLEEGYLYQRLPLESKLVLGGKEYTLVGYLDDFNAGKNDGNYTAVTCSGTVGKDIVIYVEYKSKARDNIKALANQLRLDESQIFDAGNLYTNKDSNPEEDCVIVVNTDLLILLQDGPTSQFDRAVYYGILFFFSIIVLFTGVLLVHIWGVTMGERIRQMGLLRLCGCTFCDVLAVLMGEGLLLSAMGMVAGTVFSGVVHRMIWGVVKHMRNIPLTHYQTSLHWEMAGIGIGFMLLLVLVSIFLFSIKIYGADWMDGVGGNGNIKYGTIKKASMNPFISKLPLDIRLPFCYLAGNKIRAFATTVSLSMASILTIVFLTFLDAVNVQLVEGMIKPDAQYYLFSENIHHMDELMEKMPYVEDMRVHYDTSFAFQLEEDKWRKQEYVDTFAIEDGYILTGVGGIGEDYYNEKVTMVQGEKMSYQEWEESGACLVWDAYYENNKPMRMSNYESGDVLTYAAHDDELSTYEGGSLKVAGIIQIKSDHPIDDRRYFDVTLPYKTFFERFEASTEYIFVNAKQGYEIRLGEWLEENREYYNIVINDNVTEFLQVSDTKLTLKIGLFSILLTVLLLCVVNTANTLYANQKMRKRENQFLHYLGYSRGQFLTGLATETLVYALCAALVGGFFSVIFLERVTAYLIGAATVTIGFPILYILFNIWVMLAVGLLSMVLAVRKIGEVDIV